MDEDYIDELFDLYEELCQYSDLASQIRAAEILAELQEIDPTWKEETNE